MRLSSQSLIVLGVLVLSAISAPMPAQAQCIPSPELCDGVDNDCDGTIDEVKGTRYVALGGVDLDNLCTDPAKPCATFARAIAAACANETVSVAPGFYSENVIVNKPVTVDSSSSSRDTKLTGSGPGDVVTILSGNVTWNGIDIHDAPDAACLHIGDAQHSGLRAIQVSNQALFNCGIGVVLDSLTGTPTSPWNRLMDLDIHQIPSNGQPGSGTAILMKGGVARVEVKLGRMYNTGGSAVRIDPPPTGAENRGVRIVGMPIYHTGQDFAADSHIPIAVHNAFDVNIEGLEIYENTGPVSGPDEPVVLLDRLTYGHFYCNRVRNNDAGIRLINGTALVEILHNNFSNLPGAAIALDETSFDRILIRQNLFIGTPSSLTNAAPQMLDAKDCWWGQASGPLPGQVVGNVDISGFYARDKAPILVRHPTDPGWDWPRAACYQYVQQAINAAAAGDLLLIGEGNYREHVVLDGKQLDFDGFTRGGECPVAELNGTQSGGSHIPTFRIKNTSGIHMRRLTIRSAGQGTPCGQAEGEEIGLDLQNVKDSSLTDFCTKENGVTEIRVYGDSDNNRFENGVLSGYIRDNDADDLCGHRSREGFLIDGGAACEGGANAFAEDNQIINVKTFHNTRAISLRRTKGTIIRNSLIHGVPCNRWSGGAFATSFWIQMSDDTQILDNYDVGNRGMTEGIRIQGATAADCATDHPDSVGTVIRGNSVNMVAKDYPALKIYHAAGDPGRVLGTVIECNSFTNGKTGILVEDAGTVEQPAAQFQNNDIAGNTVGMKVVSGAPVPARNNWWGSVSGPSGDGPGNGDSVYGPADYTPWLQSGARIDDDGDGFSECQGDMDDTNNQIHPGDPCDNIDNDLDGSVDENFTPQTTHCGIGACAASGQTECQAGTVADSCTPGAPLAPDDISCDQVDDDCDGSVDEDYPATPTSCGIGACARTGSYGCHGGQVSDSCHPGNPLAPTDLTCDNVDDDCDGTADEDFVPTTSSCGIGACARTGTLTCLGGGVTQNSCTPGLPTEERCNRIDDDCDGTIDNVALPAVLQDMRASWTGRSVKLEWPPVASAEAGYDIITGFVQILLSTGGDYSQAVDHCIITGFGGTTWYSKLDGPNVGDARWFLIRTRNCVGKSTWGDGGPGQAISPDPGILASGKNCP